MIASLIVKMVMTAIIVIIVTLLVGRLGPRIGGIVAGTPIVIGPAFYFLGREQSDTFVTHAALSTLHALTAVLLFLMCFVSIAGRTRAGTSVSAAVITWAISSTIFAFMPSGLWPALGLYTIVFAAALALERGLNLPLARARQSAGWHDLIIRGLAAGVLVGVATTIGAQAGPTVSGTLTGFPVGFVVISLTLHQRFGAPVARATMVTAQRGILSLLTFTTGMAVLTPLIGASHAFLPALAASLVTSALMAGIAWQLEAGS